jgi:type IV pilus assembly protein PilN
MKFSINLATQPYRKDRPILVASGAVALLMLGSLVLLISLAVADHGRSAVTRGVITKLDQQASRVAKDQSRLDAELRQPENAEVLERSLFLNALLYRKGISWTKVFSDLEKVLPPNVRLINVRPQVVSENQVYLEMTLGSDSLPPVIETLTRFESSDLFGATTLYSTVPPSQSEPLYRCRVSVNYAQKL